EERRREEEKRRREEEEKKRREEEERKRREEEENEMRKKEEQERIRKREEEERQAELERFQAWKRLEELKKIEEEERVRAREVELEERRRKEEYEREEERLAQEHFEFRKKLQIEEKRKEEEEKRMQEQWVRRKHMEDSQRNKEEERKRELEDNIRRHEAEIEEEKERLMSRSPVLQYKRSKSPIAQHSPHSQSIPSSINKPYRSFISGLSDGAIGIGHRSVAPTVEPARASTSLSSISAPRYPQHSLSNHPIRDQGMDTERRMGIRYHEDSIPQGASLDAHTPVALIPQTPLGAPPTPFHKRGALTQKLLRVGSPDSQSHRSLLTVAPTFLLFPPTEVFSSNSLTFTVRAISDVSVSVIIGKRSFFSVSHSLPEEDVWDGDEEDDHSQLFSMFANPNCVSLSSSPKFSLRTGQERTVSLSFTPKWGSKICSAKCVLDVRSKSGRKGKYQIPIVGICGKVNLGIESILEKPPSYSVFHGTVIPIDDEISSKKEEDDVLSVTRVEEENGFVGFEKYSKKQRHVGGSHRQRKKVRESWELTLSNCGTSPGFFVMESADMDEKGEFDSASRAPLSFSPSRGVLKPNERCICRVIRVTESKLSAPKVRIIYGEELERRAIMIKNGQDIDETEKYGKLLKKALKIVGKEIEEMRTVKSVDVLLRKRGPTERKKVIRERKKEDDGGKEKAENEPEERIRKQREIIEQKKKEREKRNEEEKRKKEERDRKIEDILHQRRVREVQKRFNDSYEKKKQELVKQYRIKRELEASTLTKNYLNTPLPLPHGLTTQITSTDNPQVIGTSPSHPLPGRSLPVQPTILTPPSVHVERNKIDTSPFSPPLQGTLHTSSLIPPDVPSSFKKHIQKHTHDLSIPDNLGARAEIDRSSIRSSSLPSPISGPTSLSPSSISFGTVTIGHKSTLSSVTFINGYPFPISIGSVIKRGFEISGVPHLNPNTSISLNVSFTPSSIPPTNCIMFIPLNPINPSDKAAMKEKTCVLSVEGCGSTHVLHADKKTIKMVALRRKHQPFESDDVSRVVSATQSISSSPSPSKILFSASFTLHNICSRPMPFFTRCIGGFSCLEPKGVLQVGEGCVMVIQGEGCEGEVLVFGDESQTVPEARIKVERCL
ncbi:hypothetical protein ADUPG1_009322, partial [Aduncisulcus paluster]